MALANKQALFSWGNCGHGQLGLEKTEDLAVTLPKQVQTLPRTSVLTISCGRNHTVVALKDGSVYTCGNNELGQLGHTKQWTRLEQVISLDSKIIIAVSCGHDHTTALSEAGQVFSWGSNLYGQLGLNIDDAYLSSPRMIKALALYHVVQIACGGNHSIALTNDGKVYTWGENTYGQLGNGIKSKKESQPYPIYQLTGIPVSQISAGGSHSTALSHSGILFTWGKNCFGQLGINSTDDKPFPIPVEFLRSQKIRYVCCGDDHTTALTLEGGVFTFGAGSYGQLGHGTKNNEILPKRITELMGTTVSQIACGRYHTLAYAPKSNKLYAFGLGGSGQLGIADTKNSLLPVPVLGPWLQNHSSTKLSITNIQENDDVPMSENNVPSNSDTVPSVFSGFQIKRIVCGGDHCFVLCIDSNESLLVEDFRYQYENPQILTLTLPVLEQMSEVTETEPLDLDILSHLEIVFSSSSCLNASFLKSSIAHFNCSLYNHGVNLSKAFSGFRLIEESRHATLFDLIATSLQTMFETIAKEPIASEALRLYIILPLCHLFHYTEKHVLSLICPFAKSILSLPKCHYLTLESWWETFDIPHFKNMLQIYKKAVVYFLNVTEEQNSEVNYRKHELLKISLDMLRLLNMANHKFSEKLSYQEYYIPEVQEVFNVQLDYLNWSLSKNTHHELFFCDYPFIFDAQAKSLILQADSQIQMQNAVRSAVSQNITSLFLPITEPVSVFLVLFVTRENIVTDTLNQLVSQNPEDLKKPLKVIFGGEEAVDAGGVRKEFFLLLMRELLNPKYGMFRECPETRCIWFNHETFEDDMMFHLIGIMCGLAIYNNTIINLPFPLVLYKKLLNMKPILDDLTSLTPITAKSLKEILVYEEPDFEDVFMLNFDLSMTIYGENRTYELKPNGSNIAVTRETRQEYVDKYVDFILNSSVRKLFQAFYSGFYKVCGNNVLKLFHPQELMALVIGYDSSDWRELEKNAEYKDGYSKTHPAIKMFWRVFHSLKEEEKKKFLLFLTGSDRIPILGMKSVKVILQPMRVTDNFLPVAHTCFNLLDLPHYTTDDILREKLLQAIENTEGFGLA